MDQFLNSNKRNNADKESVSSTSGATVKKRKYHKYDDSYLEFGFMSTESFGSRVYASKYIETPFRN
jgi:hypothetical protein